MSDLVGNPGYRFSHNVAQIPSSSTCIVHQRVTVWVAPNEYFIGS